MYVDYLFRTKMKGYGTQIQIKSLKYKNNSTIDLHTHKDDTDHDAAVFKFKGSNLGLVFDIIISFIDLNMA